jgi:hypothetical protein
MSFFCLEKIMKRYLWIVLPTVLLLVTSCNVFVPEPTPVDNPESPGVTATSLGEVDSTPTNSVPSATVTKSSQPDSTFTPEAEALTPTIVPTDVDDEPTQTPTIAATEIVEIKPTPTQTILGVQIGSPVGFPNFAHPDLGCQWMGLAGQIFDADDLPMDDLVVEVGGTLDGKPIFGLAVTGESTGYGPGGYEIKLGDVPIASNGSIWVQVFDLDGIALTSQTYFPTYGDCEKNVILMNFIQSYKLPTPWAYLPVINNQASHP